VDEQEDWDGATQTTASGLIRLTSVIAGLVREGAMDTRFGAKLLRRLDKESKRVAERGQTALSEADQDALFAAIGECDLALRQRDAALLVEANARLREDEEVKGKRKKSKKDDA
jgi:hypothetical protein